MKASELLEQYADGRRDFCRVDLAKQSLKGQKLSGADFSSAKLVGVKLQDADCSRAKFNKADLSGADIRGANFRAAILNGAKLINAKAGLKSGWSILLEILAFILLIASAISLGTVMLVLVEPTFEKKNEVLIGTTLNLIAALGISISLNNLKFREKLTEILSGNIVFFISIYGCFFVFFNFFVGFFRSRFNSFININFAGLHIPFEMRTEYIPGSRILSSTNLEEISGTQRDSLSELVDTLGRIISTLFDWAYGAVDYETILVVFVASLISFLFSLGFLTMALTQLMLDCQKEDKYVEKVIVLVTIVVMLAANPIVKPWTIVWGIFALYIKYCIKKGDYECIPGFIGFFLRLQSGEKCFSIDKLGVSSIGTNFYKANLMDADCSKANFRNANFSKCNLERTNLYHVKGLHRAVGFLNFFHYGDLPDKNTYYSDEIDGGLLIRDPNLSNRMRKENIQLMVHHGLEYFRSYEKKILLGVNLSDPEIILEPDCSKPQLSFSNTIVIGSNISKAVFKNCMLYAAEFRKSELSKSKFINCQFERTVFRDCELNGTNFSEADLTDGDLSNSRLIDANLHKAKLIRTRLLGTDLSGVNLTGACIQDWNINSATKFEGAICEYVYLKADNQERRPREGSFKPGEFAALFQQAVDTVDLIFKDGIDWQAFFQSFQDLRSQYADQDLSIQAIEKKRGGAFVVRLEVSPEADKPAIESSAKKLYETKLSLMEQHYRDVLNAKEGEIVAYKQQSANLMEIIKLQRVRSPMAEVHKYDLRGAQFAGGFAENVQGDQIGGTINNYGASLDDITRLLSTLRDQAQTFPIEHKDEVLDVLNDLERDIQEPEPDQNRIRRRLKRLGAIAATVGAIASGVATFSGDLNAFAGNVGELTEMLGIPIEQVKPNQIPPATP